MGGVWGRNIFMSLCVCILRLFVRELWVYSYLLESLCEPRNIRGLLQWVVESTTFSLQRGGVLWLQYDIFHDVYKAEYLWLFICCLYGSAICWYYIQWCTTLCTMTSCIAAVLQCFKRVNTKGKKASFNHFFQ